MLHQLGKITKGSKRFGDSVEACGTSLYEAYYTCQKKTYLIQSFWYLLENKCTINDLYGSMYNIPDRIRERKTSVTDSSVTSTFFITMQRIVRIIAKNQAYGGKWIISEEIVDTVRICIYISLVMSWMRFWMWSWTRWWKIGMVRKRLDIWEGTLRRRK